MLLPGSREKSSAGNGLFPAAPHVPEIGKLRGTCCLLLFFVASALKVAQTPVHKQFMNNPSRPAPGTSGNVTPGWSGGARPPRAQFSAPSRKTSLVAAPSSCPLLPQNHPGFVRVIHRMRGRHFPSCWFPLLSRQSAAAADSRFPLFTCGSAALRPCALAPLR
jgi:hypothetical protein